MSLHPRVLSVTGTLTSRRTQPKASTRLQTVSRARTYSTTCKGATPPVAETGSRFTPAPPPTPEASPAAASSGAADGPAGHDADGEDAGVSLGSPEEKRGDPMPDKEEGEPAPSAPITADNESVAQSLIREMRDLCQLIGKLLAALPSEQRASRPRARPAGPEFIDGQRLLDIDAVCKLVGASRSTVYDWLKTGAFVPPIKTGKRSVRYRESDVMNWIQKRSAETPIQRREEAG